MSSMESKLQTAPSDVKPDVRSMNGHVADAKVKVEEKMNESQLTRLATRVTIHAGLSLSAMVGTALLMSVLG